MRIPIICLLFAMVFAAQAQEVRGRVLSKNASGNTESLPGATVQWPGTRSGTVTDDKGEFGLGVPPGATILVASYVGFTSDTVVYSGQTFIQFILKEGVDMGPVTIEKEKDATELSLMDPLKFQTLGEKELCKAACCNLSESFETNASIDASFTDAITGTKQIKMLGLDGRYTQIMFDNVPAVRGLASTYGLTYVPGPWINSIMIAKGTGSVVSGYESITGQINVSHKNPDNAEKLYLNGFAGTGGRMELNVVRNQPVSEHWHTTLLAHGAMSQLRSDMNNDDFLDNPLFKNIILRNEWMLESDGGLGGTYQATYIHLENTSGQYNFDPKDELLSTLWGVNTTTDRIEFSAKTGYVFSKKDWKSFGSQLSGSWHQHTGEYGFRNYSGEQISARVNLLYASHIVNESHKFTSGVSFLYDDYVEQLDSVNYDRTESVPGAFVEYTWLQKELLTVVAGLRMDHHNAYGVLVTPRLHARYSFDEHTSLKIAAGKGYRTANVFMDNVGMFASNRIFQFIGTDSLSEKPFGLEMEEAWNFGVVLGRKFKINHRDANISLDAFRTEFVNQVVMDMETPGRVSFYNLSGPSYSNSAQIEFQWSPFKRFDLRLAYRWLDVKTQYDSLLLEKPMVAKHRAFTNLAYETKVTENGAQWRFDVTVKWLGEQRVPAYESHEGHIEFSSASDPFIQVNAQITRVFRKNLEVYLGGENLTNYMQHHAIISAEDPSSENFDASLVWGPVFGTMGYFGFRWKIE